MRQHLLIDADDTLWENNIYFERAFDEFVSFLDHSSLSGDAIRAILDEIELANIKVNGYGAANFGRNLCQCYERLVERDILPGDAECIMGFAENIMAQPIEIIDGVPETLEYLSVRHDLTLFTKGHPEEQKLEGRPIRPRYLLRAHGHRARKGRLGICVGSAGPEALG